MTAQDPDADVRRLSGDAFLDADPTAWFERLYADAAQGQAIVPWDRRAPHPLLVDGSSSKRLARAAAPWWWAPVWATMQRSSRLTDTA